ncbi:2-C-methyl-D-erythritol 2,4-cyclodiphosphate synthase [Entomospira culicis]|uniref:2-C-methyl-D-erythritol 2,4-cyclodiphosphate synthase n=1 Tax=Entomospira culicis TaxID=2719989 RepID=A0A968GL67_9SPIO|nr:2-C-methyl-D-erythritol 2,4-cyclodiphosphate synthase [Entomospira culicis]NIZ19260.1 2-C-methyl-D-erythritol 2,4-cyclodiphosphate synthase [Entomospira culicis]NIZ69835.1 2-C-methyl-D-erythritol 2,4-cyclodiphosphate synthase [Entomospira culicis]WDI36941.1 2-C-methyl-D-erythritol 2,4-cyclodiphosphate synthase [Entomospira culicis]WDI38570.1 2-C-methyl-D-erythritol 2,4-cyclodiphosphate synthase [Entomospira culicis]
MQEHYRIGLGEDIHRLGAPRPLWLAGMEVSPSGGAIAHSDGDVVLHALIDALLGALALGDIGDHFPPSDPAYRDMASTLFLEKVLPMIHQRGYRINNCDITIRLERPKLYPFKQALREHLAKLLHVDIEQISLKAKTSEGLDAVGEGEAVFCQVAVLLARQSVPLSL